MQMVQAEFGDDSPELAAHLEVIAQHLSCDLKIKRATALLQHAITIRKACCRKATSDQGTSMRDLAHAHALAAEHALQSLCPWDALHHAQESLHLCIGAMHQRRHLDPDARWSTQMLASMHTLPDFSKQLEKPPDSSLMVLHALPVKKAAAVASRALIVQSKLRAAGGGVDAVTAAVNALACAKFHGGSHSIAAACAHAQLCACTVIELATKVESPLQPGRPLEITAQLAAHLRQRVQAMCDMPSRELNPDGAVTRQQSCCLASHIPCTSLLDSPRPQSNTHSQWVLPAPRASMGRDSSGSHTSLESIANTGQTSQDNVEVVLDHGTTAQGLQACDNRLKKCARAFLQHGPGSLEFLLRSRLDRAHLLHLLVRRLLQGFNYVALCPSAVSKCTFVLL
jgi:hypothetical protein